MPKHRTALSLNRQKQYYKMHKQSGQDLILPLALCLLKKLSHRSLLYISTPFFFYFYCLYSITIIQWLFPITLSTPILTPRITRTSWTVASHWCNTNGGRPRCLWSPVLWPDSGLVLFNLSRLDSIVSRARQGKWCKWRWRVSRENNTDRLAILSVSWPVVRLREDIKEMKWERIIERKSKGMSLFLEVLCPTYDKTVSSSFTSEYVHGRWGGFLVSKVEGRHYVLPNKESKKDSHTANTLWKRIWEKEEENNRLLGEDC